MATHSSMLVWEIPWTEEPGGLQFMPGDRPWKLLGGPESRLWISSSYLVNRTPWPLGAGEGSVVLGNEAASLSDPCPHGQAALKSVE